MSEAPPPAVAIGAVRVRGISPGSARETGTQFRGLASQLSEMIGDGAVGASLLRLKVTRAPGESAAEAAARALGRHFLGAGRG